MPERSVEMRLIPSAGGGRWVPRLASVLFFALFCALLAYWAMRLFEPAVRIAPSGSLAGRENLVGTSAAANLFGRAQGGGAPAQAIASNFKLLGLISDPQRGAAVISVDGKPAEAFGVGARIDDGHTLKSVDPRGAVLLHGADEIRLDAPPIGDVGLLSRGPADSADGATPARGTVALRPLPPSGADAAREEPPVPPKPEMMRPPTQPEPPSR